MKKLKIPLAKAQEMLAFQMGRFSDPELLQNARLALNSGDTKVILKVWAIIKEIR